MKVLIVLTVIVLADFGGTHSVPSTKGRLVARPCFPCSDNYSPMCARPTKGGEAKTFRNFCHVKAEDCGLYETRE